HGEELFQANVTSVRAVTTQAQQRCWVDREQVVRSEPNVPGAIIGGVIGGVLGHQIGGGRGKDVATALGAVGGAAVGANAGGGGSQVVTQDVQRCRTVQGPVRPDYWDVAYVFRGREHHVQMSSPPGATITVNRDGEPRM
ncbi:MAG TPA: glycine zipper 2TM domain-containing protein, partial [Casimicrobiaceae bacterium]|nr:glycine zipper 2TM domain-containing protein [Casimicrobiaceae bacterium]